MRSNEQQHIFQQGDGRQGLQEETCQLAIEEALPSLPSRVPCQQKTIQDTELPTLWNITIS